MNPWSGRTALVTGASSGLGADFARLLAEAGANLVLVARREEKLAALRDEIVAREPVRVDVVPADLTDEAARLALVDELTARSLAVDVLVNNAGLGVYGPFFETSWEKDRGLFRLDVEAVVHLTRLFGRPMLERGSGWILLVGSIGAFQPAPSYATYAAAKAFVASFGEALSFELRGTGVRVSVSHPGPTGTEFFSVAGQKLTIYQRLTMMESRAVARAALRGLARGKPFTVPGVVNWLGTWSMRFLPRRTAARIAWLCMRNP